MEIRQLKYFVAVAEELHFGHAAEREHIVQSALSQQVRLLEREIGARLLDRNTHQVKLTNAGVAFLAEARTLLVRLNRAAMIARRAADEPTVFRVGSTEASYDSIAVIIDQLLVARPDVEVNQFEAVVSHQYDMLATGQLDVGIGCASLAPALVASYQFREDPMGVLVSEDHLLANEVQVTVGDLQGVSRPGRQGDDGSDSGGEPGVESERVVCRKKNLHSRSEREVIYDLRYSIYAPTGK